MENNTLKTESRWDDIRLERLNGVLGEKQMLCAALGRALMDDPFTHFVYQSEEQRRDVLPLFLENFVNCCLKDGHVDMLLAPDGNIVGGALWMGPDVTMVTPGVFIWRMITGRTLRAAMKLGMAGLSRLAKFGDEVEAVHHQAPMPHYYLSVLGLVPEYQGKGLGGRLLSPTVEMARQRRISVFAESTNPQNLTFYERQGFNRFHDGNPASGPQFYALQMFP